MIYKAKLTDSNTYETTIGVFVTDKTWKQVEKLYNKLREKWGDDDLASEGWGLDEYLETELSERGIDFSIEKADSRVHELWF